jgi:hypothetical protein
MVEARRRGIGQAPKKGGGGRPGTGALSKVQSTAPLFGIFFAEVLAIHATAVTWIPSAWMKWARQITMQNLVDSDPLHYAIVLFLI